MSIWAVGVGAASNAQYCTTLQAGGTGCSYVSAQTGLPHDPNAEYELWSNHTVEAVPRVGGRYLDYYGYSSYYDPYDPLYYPLSYYFYPGGSYEIDFSNIVLGELFAIASRGTMHGQPHHLKAVSDVTFNHDCGQGQPVREWRFKVVDFWGRNAGRVPIKEHFQEGTIVSSCNGETVPATPCGRNHPYNNGYYDTVSPGGCLPDICGFMIRYNEWRWCPRRGRPEVILATMLYQVYTDSIKLNGSTNLTGQEIF